MQGTSIISRMCESIVSISFSLVLAQAQWLEILVWSNLLLSRVAPDGRNEYNVKCTLASDTDKYVFCSIRRVSHKSRSKKKNCIRLSFVRAQTKGFKRNKRMHGIDDSDKCKSESVDTLIQNHRQLYLSLVQKNGRALKDLPVGLRNDKLIVLAAVQQYGNTLKHASSELQEDPEIVLAAVTQYGSALQYTTRLHRGDEDIVLAAVTPSVKAFAAQDGRAFQHATTKLRTNRKFVLAAAKRNGWILQSAPDTLRNDPKVVKTAVTQDGRVLRYASRNMRGAYDIVFAAVTQNGRALRCASEKLRNHREIVCIAVAQNAQALQYASPELRESLATELVVKRDRRIAELEKESTCMKTMS